MEGQALQCTMQFCFSLVLLTTTVSAQQDTKGSLEILSCGSKGAFLSLNRALAPLGMVTSSSSTTSYTTTEIYNFGFVVGGYFDTWCTTDTDANPYIDMGLTSPVLITQILSSGRTTPTESFYVTNFTIEFSPPNETTTLNYYTTESGTTQYFTAPRLNTLIQLERPLLTRRLRLRPVDWFDSDSGKIFEYVCHGIGLYGCLATEAIEITSEDEKELTSAPAGEATNTIITLGDSSSTAAQSVPVVVQDNQAVAIVVPIALLTIIINGALVGVGIYVCLLISRKIKDHEGRQIVQGYLDVSKSFEQQHSEQDVTANSDDYEKQTNEMKTDDDDLLDNMAYGQVDSQPQITECQAQYETVVDLNKNASYSSVSATPMPIEGAEYTYITRNLAPADTDNMNDYIYS